MEMLAGIINEQESFWDVVERADNASAESFKSAVEPISLHIWSDHNN